MLASKGMQFALGEQPLVTSVWLVILSEASKNRSSKFKWVDADFELIGFARLINCSVPVFNQSIALLERINYIRRHDGIIEVLGWDAMQSDYAKGLDKGYYKKTSKKLASNKEVSSARGEEKRREEREESGALSKFSEAPSWEEFWTYCQSPHCGIAAEWYAKDKFWAACQDKWSKKSDWRAYARRVRGWWDNDGRPMKPTQNHGNKNTTKPNPRNFGIAEDPAEAGRRTAANVKRRQAERAAELAAQEQVAAEMASGVEQPAA